jgi:hypothetical protein
METTETTTTATTTAKNKITFLADGVTGKQMLNLKFAANKANKDELHSFSFCIKQFLKHGVELLASFKTFDIETITPANLLKQLTEAEKLRLLKNGNKFSFYLVENLIIRHIKETLK